MMKICSNCKIEKILDDFTKNKRSKDGRKNICKLCFNKKYKMSKEARKEYYQNNKNNWIKYNLENKDKIAEYKKEYREKNKEEISLKQKEYVNNNIEILKVKWKIYRDSNKESMRKWLDENKEHRKNYKKNYNSKNKHNRNIVRKKRRDSDIIYKIKENIRSRISNSIKSKGYTKKSKSYVILGCEYLELKIYIESKFESWMTWENYGLYNGEFNYGWDIDHIIPLSSAKTEDEVIKLNHYTNLQPLCSKINRNIKMGF